MRWDCGMKIYVNGEEKKVFDSLTVTALLEELGIQRDRIAVELNLDIVPKESFADTVLKEGDRLEIVSFVGGGQWDYSHKRLLEMFAFSSDLKAAGEHEGTTVQ